MHTYPSKSNNLRRSKQFSKDPSPLLDEIFSVTMYLAISPLAFLAYTEDILPCHVIMYIFKYEYFLIQIELFI